MGGKDNGRKYVHYKSKAKFFRGGGWTGKLVILYGKEKSERQEALRIFRHMLEHRLYSGGFVSKDKSDVGLKILGKTISEYSEPADGDKVIILDKLFDHGENSPLDVRQPLYVLNPKMQTGNFVIWGCGANGDFVYQYLKRRNMQVSAFIDSDFKKAGGQKYQLPILGSNHLDRLPKDAVIILAANCWQEMEEVLKDQKMMNNRFYYAALDWEIPTVENQSFSMFQIKTLSDKLTNKRVFIYSGNEENAACWKQYLTLLDFCCEQDTLDYIEQLLYEENSAVVVLEDKVKDLYLLEECGISEQDIVCIYRDRIEHYPYVYGVVPYDLDINLGYTWSGVKYPGIEVYGKESEADYKIAVLGGSTTDGHDWPYKSWPEFLFEKYSSRDVTIYNGGTSGYKSFHELLKLIRDMLCFKPDMIIVYDGVNDLENTSSGLFADYYLESVFKFAARNMEPGYDGYERSGKVYSGIPRANEDAFAIWLSNIELMRAIAEDKGIQFYSFMQPVIFSKKNRDKEEQEIILSSPVTYSDRIQPSFRNLAKEREICKTHSYIYDLSYIFDDIHGVYIDTCHVNERGNCIIANEIFEVIRKERKEYEHLGNFSTLS